MSELATGLLRFWQAGGILMPILAAISFGIWYFSLSLYIPLFFASRRLKRFSPDCTAIRGAGAATPVATAAKGKMQETSPVGVAGDACPGFDVAGFRASQLCPYERHLGILHALVACAPLLGLLGTVKGMIATFVALGGRGVASMDLLSLGISEALITTQVGLVVAIPGLVSAHASARLIVHMKNALDRVGIHQAMRQKTTAQTELAEVPT